MAPCSSYSSDLFPGDYHLGRGNFLEEKRLVKKVWKNALGRSRLIFTIEEIDKRKNMYIRVQRETRGCLSIAHYAFAFIK